MLSQSSMLLPRLVLNFCQMKPLGKEYMFIQKQSFESVCVYIFLCPSLSWFINELVNHWIIMEWFKNYLKLWLHGMNSYLEIVDYVYGKCQYKVPSIEKLFESKINCEKNNSWVMYKTWIKAKFKRKIIITIEANWQFHCHLATFIITVIWWPFNSGDSHLR